MNKISYSKAFLCILYLCSNIRLFLQQLSVNLPTQRKQTGSVIQVFHSFVKKMKPGLSLCIIQWLSWCTNWLMHLPYITIVASLFMSLTQQNKQYCNTAILWKFKNGNGNNEDKRFLSTVIICYPFFIFAISIFHCAWFYEACYKKLWENNIISYWNPQIPSTLFADTNLQPLIMILKHVK